MTYAYHSKIYLAEVALNVRDLARQTAFYTQVLGLEILSQTDREVILGAGGKALVHLIQTNREETVKSSYGLYHMAILLPSREDLADVFKHIAELKFPLSGRQIMAIARLFIWKIRKEMASNSIEINLSLTGISGRMAALLG